MSSWSSVTGASDDEGTDAEEEDDVEREAERRDEEVGGGGGGCAAHAEAEETQHGMNNAETQMYAPSDDEDENQENVAQ